MQVLTTMHLLHVADTVVGDETSAKNAGISSGERKRVNIAMELAAYPSVLFLDEPTTGALEDGWEEGSLPLRSVTVELRERTVWRRVPSQWQ